MEGKNLVIALAVVTLCLAFANITIQSLKYKQMTGYITANQSVAQINITIMTNLKINFTRNNATWGKGLINGTGDDGLNATLSTSRETASVQRGNWTYSDVKGFILQNIGTVNASLRISSNVNASFLFGKTPDTQREFYINVTNKDAGACVFNTSFVTATWYTPNLTSLGLNGANVVCNQFGFLDTQDEIYVDHLLTVPHDANTTNAELIAILTATAETAA